MYDHVIRLNEVSIRPTEILRGKILQYPCELNFIIQ